MRSSKLDLRKEDCIKLLSITKNDEIADILVQKLLLKIYYKDKSDNKINKENINIFIVIANVTKQLPQSALYNFRWQMKYRYFYMPMNDNNNDE